MECLNCKDKFGMCGCHIRIKVLKKKSWLGLMINGFRLKLEKLYELLCGP